MEHGSHCAGAEGHGWGGEVCSSWGSPGPGSRSFGSPGEPGWRVHRISPPCRAPHPMELVLLPTGGLGKGRLSRAMLPLPELVGPGEVTPGYSGLQPPAPRQQQSPAGRCWPGPGGSAMGLWMGGGIPGSSCWGHGVPRSRTRGRGQGCSSCLPPMLTVGSRCAGSSIPARRVTKVPLAPAALGHGAGPLCPGVLSLQPSAEMLPGLSLSLSPSLGPAPAMEIREQAGKLSPTTEFPPGSAGPRRQGISPSSSSSSSPLSPKVTHLLQGNPPVYLPTAPTHTLSAGILPAGG